MKLDCNIIKYEPELIFSEGKFKDTVNNSKTISSFDKYDIFDNKNEYLGHIIIHNGFNNYIMLHGIFLETAKSGTGQKVLKSLSKYAFDNNLKKVVIAAISDKQEKILCKDGDYMNLDRTIRKNIFNHIGQKLVNEGVIFEVKENDTYSGIEYIIKSE